MTIEKYSDAIRNQLLQTWERSVRATHAFVTPTDLEEIKALVHTFNFNQLQVYCLMDNNTLTGFIGVAEGKVEMLFVDPAYIGKGCGKQLLLYAIQELHANKVDVNEQNEHAAAFYRRFGFKVYERTEKDDHGKNYPLLRMQLKNKHAVS